MTQENPGNTAAGLQAVQADFHDRPGANLPGCHGLPNEKRGIFREILIRRSMIVFAARLREDANNLYKGSDGVPSPDG